MLEPTSSHLVCGVAGPGRYTWPLATFGSFIYRQSEMQDCAKAAALAEFLYWSQTSSAAEQIASRFCKLLDRHSDHSVADSHTPHTRRQGFVLATSVDILRRHFFNLLANFTCQGKPVSSVHACVQNGELCSGSGSCSNNSCLCNNGWCGTFCQRRCSADSPAILPIVLGTLPRVDIYGMHTAFDSCALRIPHDHA